jgi:hypothetical protein
MFFLADQTHKYLNLFVAQHNALSFSIYMVISTTLTTQSTMRLHVQLVRLGLTIGQAFSRVPEACIAQSRATRS